LKKCYLFDVIGSFDSFVSAILGEMLELSEAIRDYHDSTEFPHMVCNCFYVNPINEPYANLGKEEGNLNLCVPY